MRITNSMLNNLNNMHVTVLLPTYNCAAFIGLSIKSILNQTYKDFELLIIDDGSTDNTEEVVSRYKDSRIVYKMIDHQGLGAALNYGLKNSTGDWIARIDADDFAHPCRLYHQVNFINMNANYGVISSWYAVHNGKKILYIIKSKRESYEIKNRFMLHNDIIHAGSFYNKRLILDAGAYKKHVFEDFELWLRLRNKTEFYNIPKVLTFVQYRKNSLSRDNIKEKNSIIYSALTKEYPIKVIRHVESLEKDESNSIAGWREFFWGDKLISRILWRKTLIKKPFNFKLLTAYILTYLPMNIFFAYKEARIRFRIEYILYFFTVEFNEARKKFNELLNKENISNNYFMNKCLNEKHN